MSVARVESNPSPLTRLTVPTKMRDARRLPQRVATSQCYRVRCHQPIGVIAGVQRYPPITLNWLFRVA